MSEASSRAEMERRLVQRSLEDESFRQRLLEDPKAAMEEELETRLPEEVQVRAVEESAETIYLVLPPGTSSTGQQESGEISDRELEAVAGAGTHKPRGSLAPSSRLVAEWNAPDPVQMADHGAAAKRPEPRAWLAYNWRVNEGPRADLL